MNRTDRLYALTEELRAVTPRPRSARWLADRFEVSARTIERDISALQQSGVPVRAEPGRTGGYCLDKERTLPPVNFTPGEAMALAVHSGGLLNTGGALPGYAVFGVLVENVADAIQRVEAAGGSVRRAPEVTSAGITFAHLLDPAGNQFEVFSMPPGGE